jgi:transposase
MERLRIERHLAIARAARLRTRGVKLKKMPVGRPKRLSDQEVRELRQLAIDLA